MAHVKLVIHLSQPFVLWSDEIELKSDIGGQQSITNIQIE